MGTNPRFHPWAGFGDVGQRQWRGWARLRQSWLMDAAGDVNQATNRYAAGRGAQHRSAQGIDDETVRFSHPILHCTQLVFSHNLPIITLRFDHWTLSEQTLRGTAINGFKGNLESFTHGSAGLSSVYGHLCSSPQPRAWLRSNYLDGDMQDPGIRRTG